MDLDKLGQQGLVLDGIFYEVPQLRILQGAYLKVVPGTICGLFGRNGSGKSTLLKIAAGQFAPDSGLTIIDGERLHRKALRFRFTKVSYLPQDSMLPGDMAVRRLIESFPTDSSSLSRDPIISDLLGKRVDELSVGRRRYLEIQLLLSLERAYVLLDEPFTGVEPNMIDLISERIIDAAKRGKGILLTDHYQHYTLPIVNDAYLIANRQCRHLNPMLDLRTQLQEYGYISNAWKEGHSA
ncbi:MAG TPA: ATP-binding cassette domain-containing protein [Rhodothermales bacterium]|nr:ATP-binding cassette domain-containing protein [Rhodothermales bacterium]